MSSSSQQDTTKQVEERRRSGSSSSSSTSSSTSNSISLVKLDELSSFGATKQARLPALIKLNPLTDLNSREGQLQAGPSNTNSMPDFSGSQLEKMVATESPAVAATQQQQQQSLPANLEQPIGAAAGDQNDKENSLVSEERAKQTGANQDDSVDGFQVVEMEQMSMNDTQMVGPSLPPPATGANDGNNNNNGQERPEGSNQNSGAADLVDRSLAAASLLNKDQQQYASHLGDSLIEMIINLRNENQNLIKALEVNNSYVKERLSEFKRCQEESKKREMEFQLEKAELEHNLRKVQRQNSVLSERLKSMESKLKDMKAEVSDSLLAANSSKASSVRGEENLYPQLADSESFGNSALRSAGDQAATMQVDATSGELYNDGDHQSQAGGSRPMETDQDRQQTAAKEVASMSKEELSARFDAKKVDFYAMDDPMKQCDQLEQQLNDIGKRDYEICLLQQQLNIYRQDFRLERMAKLEAKIQIEKLKNEIDRLCLDRLGRGQNGGGDDEDGDLDERQRYGPTPATAAADGLIGKLGHHLSRKALKSAAKAAKYASKQAHLEEKAAAALARAAAAKAAAASHFTAPPAPTAQPNNSQQPSQEAPTTEHPGPAPPLPPHLHHSRRHHLHQRAHHHHRGPRGIRGEIVSDLMSTANKAMLTGYNLASTTINSALDKLSQFEQQQAAQATDPNRPRPGAGLASGGKPSAPPMDTFPSVD